MVSSSVLMFDKITVLKLSDCYALTIWRSARRSPDNNTRDWILCSDTYDFHNETRVNRRTIRFGGCEGTKAKQTDSAVIFVMVILVAM